MLIHKGSGMKSVQKMHRRSRRKATRGSKYERGLQDSPLQTTEALGCHVCPDRPICGGIHPRVASYNCLQLCCGTPDECDRVCRKNPDFVDRVREVGKFDLETVPRNHILESPDLPNVAPVIYHRGGRMQPIPSTFVALPLSRMFERHTGMPRFVTRDELYRKFGIHSDTKVMLTGTDRDRPLERWWGMGEERRRTIIRSIKAAGVTIVTTPNYSLFVDRPRWDDLHSIKRIAITHAEFLSEGLPAALHVNGRTKHDFRRWTSYISDRPEITHIAYEFTTGTGRGDRQELHVIWLQNLAADVGRPLHLILRGGIKVIHDLSESFSHITVVETNSFIKTVNRKRAHLKEDMTVDWKDSPTDPGAPLDALFSHNKAAVRKRIQHLLSSPAKETCISEI